MSVRRPFLGALLGGALLGLLACGGGSSQPDIVLVTIDTLRADHVGAYGSKNARTPVMDRLAREGVRFDQASTPVPVTLPAHASLFTAEMPSRHGVRNNLIYALRDDVPTLAERLRAKGYRTGAFVSAAPVARRFGLGRGFEVYDDHLGGGAQTAFEFPERRGADTVKAALDWLRGQPGDRPVFVWVHMFEPHAPYLPQAPFAEGFAHPYDGEIATADAALGQLVGGFDAARSRDRITVVTSDHGEGLGQHGEESHSFFLFESTVRVPLIVHAPGRWPAGTTVTEPVSIMDIGPTVLAMAGVEATLGPDGIALDPTNVPRRRLLAETLYTHEAFGWSPMFAMREGSQKVIRSHRSRAYDVIADPDETNDLVEQGAAWPSTLFVALDAMVASISPAAAPAGVTRQPTAAEAQALAALGYAGGGATVGEAATGAALLEAVLTHPEGTERAAEFDAMKQAQISLEANQPQEAIAPLRAVVDANPGNGWALSLLGGALRATGDLAGAAEAFERAAAVQPLRAEHFVAAAELRDALGTPEDAMVWYERALDLMPTSLSLLREAADVFGRNDRVDRALARVEIGLELADPHAPDRADLLGLMAAVCLQAGQPDRAEPYLKQARALDDKPVFTVMQAQLAGARGNWRQVNEMLTPLPSALARDAHAVELKALALERLDEPERALQLFQSAVSLDDTRDVAHAHVAILLLRLRGDADGALGASVRALQLATYKPEHHVVYVNVLEALGEAERARAHLEKWAPRFPTHEALRALAERHGVAVDRSR